jgi:hypothetical protein
LIVATAADTPARLAVGSANQVLTVDSSTATGLKWATPSSSPLTTKGDIYTYSTADTRLPVGTNNFLLGAASGESTGLKWLGAWTTYTPTTTGYTIGNGTQEWRYLTLGKVVFVYGSVKFGSTTSMTGALTFTLPSSISQINSQYHQIGYVDFEDAGTTSYFGQASYYSIQNRVDINVLNSSTTYLGNSNTSSTVPMTWTTNDSFDVMCWYQEA